MRFVLTDLPIDAIPSRHQGAGGFVSFEGKVRDHAHGRRVLRLEYEAYPELAQKEGDALIREAVERFGLLDASVSHRTGTLEIGETAVLIQVAAAHRREAFAGCEWIIDQLKVRVPIFKREYYAEGDSGWVGMDSPARDEAFARAYSDRQERLAEVGAEGQAKLSASRVLLVGVGGLGSGSLPYLAGAGIGTLGLVDPDAVEVENLHRQVIFAAGDAGRSKVERASAFARRLNPGVLVEVHPEALDAANVDRLVATYDWVVDGTDSLATKFLLNSACRRYGKPLVVASVHRFEGQILMIAPDGPCLRCLFPVAPPDACVGTCAEIGILGVVPGLLGILQANEVLKGILGYGEVLDRHLLLIDLRSGQSERLSRDARAGCPVCGGTGEDPSDWEVASLDEMRRRFGDFRLIDVREVDELPNLPVLHERIPSSRFAWVGPDVPAVLCCSTGARSLALVLRLREEGRQRVFSLRGGVRAVVADARR